MRIRTLFTALLISAFWGTAIAQPTDLVTPHGRHFDDNGQTFEFVGVNLRGVAHYGGGDILPFSQASDIANNLDGVVNIGGKVVRLFAANKHTTVETDIARLETVLDAMEARGLKAIVCFTDVYTTGFHPAGDDGYYQSQPSGFTILDDSWFAGGYEDNYLPWVRAAVEDLKNHNAVFAWELGNELTDIKNPSNIIDFTLDVAAEIKSIDPHHMVTTGFLSIDHTQIGVEEGIALYSSPNLDFITVHSYDGSEPIQNWEAASRLEKPLVVEEFGWNINNGDRAANTSAQMTKWFDGREARGFMQWGFQAINYDNGDGDLIFGMDDIGMPDWDEMVALYLGRAADLASGQGPLPPLGPPAGINIAPDSTAVETDSDFSAAFTGVKAIDRVVSPDSKWTSDGSQPPHWIALDLGGEKEITGYIVRMSNDGGEQRHYSFTSFEIQSGPTLSGPWTTRFDVENPAQFSARTLREDPVYAARYIRLLIGDPGIDNYARLPELEVYGGVPPESDNWILY